MKVKSLHRVPASVGSRCRSYSVTCGIYFGGLPITAPLEVTDGAVQASSWFSMIVFPLDKMEFSVAVSHLPREARLVFCVYGNPDDKPHEPLGWVALPLFDHEGLLCTGDRLLGLWPDAVASPSGTSMSNILQGFLCAYINSLLFRVQFLNIICLDDMMFTSDYV